MPKKSVFAAAEAKLKQEEPESEEEQARRAQEALEVRPGHWALSQNPPLPSLVLFFPLLALYLPSSCPLLALCLPSSALFCPILPSFVSGVLAGALDRLEP